MISTAGGAQGLDQFIYHRFQIVIVYYFIFVLAGIIFIKGYFPLSIINIWLASSCRLSLINAWFFPFVYPVLKDVNWILFHPQKLLSELFFFFYYCYKLTDLNPFDEFQSIAIFIEAEIVPSLANRSLFKFIPDSFSRDLSGIRGFLPICYVDMLQVQLAHPVAWIWYQPVISPNIPCCF